MKDPDSSVASPCIGHCCLDDEDMCVGCFRQLEEILSWATFDEDQRRNVIKSCESRKQILKAERGSA